MRTRSPALALLLAIALCACDPHYNWRDYSSPDAPYSVLFPDRPATHTREVRLDALTVNMTMAAAQVDDVAFAVGSATVPDASQAPAALRAMQTALVNNIGATIIRHGASTNGPQTTLDVEARGVRNGEPALLIGRFISRDRHVYQVIVMGAERHIDREQVDTYFSSFKVR